MPVSKQSGIGANFYVGGYDLSLDTGSVDQISSPVGVLDATGVKQVAMARLGGLHDADWQFTSFLNITSVAPFWTNNLQALPRTDQTCNLFLAHPPGYVQAVGSDAAGMRAIQVNYDPTRDTTGNLTFKTEIQNDGHGMEWGVALTPGVRTDTIATAGTVYDNGAGAATPPMIPSATSVINPSPLTASVVISGGTISNVIVNGVSVGTGPGTYPVPSGQFISIVYTVAPTWVWTWTFTPPAVPASGVNATNPASEPATVVISGGTGVGNVTVAGVVVGSGDGTYVVQGGQTISVVYATAPTWTWTLQSSLGINAYLQVFAFTGTSVDIFIEHSTTGTSGWTTLLDFGAQSALGAQRNSITGQVNRYLRVSTGAGTFSSVSFAAMFTPNFLTAGF
jgi:hypothetical protein